ncbi:MAG: hypothetical protein M3P46_07900 [Actinomycetota bacterium]|nr:hypothetical protein [Actinomycetota bacterium]
MAALGAAVAFGAAAVLQSIAGARSPHVPGVDPRLLLRLARDRAFIAALLLNGLGFLLHVTALHTLPLFLVQAVIASSVAVAALLSVPVSGVPLTVPRRTALVAVVLGLGLLAPTAEEGEAQRASTAVVGLLLAAVVAIAAGAVLAARLHGTPEAVLLGLLAGTGFGLVAVCGRLLPGLDVGTVLTQPVTVVAVLAGLVAYLLYSVALQQGTATVVTAALVVPQTALPALLGMLLGDRVRPGLGVLAAFGFVVALAGTLALARLEREQVA